MKLSILAALVLVAATSNALSMDKGDNKNIYVTESGKRLTPIEAFTEALAGTKVLQCAYVEAVGNERTGKVALKKVK